MKSIVVKYLAPTNTKGARFVASDEDGNRVCITPGTDRPFEEAALALCRKMNWLGHLVQGSIKGAEVFVWLRDEPISTSPIHSMFEDVEITLRSRNDIHGKGMVVKVVWGVPYNGINHKNQGVVVRQMQYGMDSVPFIVSDDWRSVRFLGKLHPVLVSA